ncbi:nuclear transport factor 2 family protein [Mycetocola zhadangensis]|uniref:nuclear transport factor 2 family protein n=1 Tax=Mycetocola zhadangensis TaxID=1164595 RepID=UPI003A4D256D
MTSQIKNWMDGYLRAWETNAPEDIRALFTDDAEYRTEPWVPPWVGHDAIVAGWLERQDEPGSAEFSWSIVVDTDAVSIVEATTNYSGGPTYSNLWVIRFGTDGRARSYTEWWMDQAKPS